MQHDLVAGLDIGSSKTCVALGKRTHSGVSLIGAGVTRTKGLRGGVPADVRVLTQAIHTAADDARARVGCEIPPVVVSVPRLSRREQLPTSSQLDQRAAHEHLASLVQCIEGAGLEVADTVPSAEASALGVLSASDKARGVALVDIGASFTNVAVYIGGALVRSVALPIGGLYITSDISQGLRVSLREAERVKHAHGDVLVREGYDREQLELASINHRPQQRCTRAEVVAVIEPRATEILLGAAHVIKFALLGETLDAGVVLCGGASRLVGLAQLAEQLLSIPVRTARPLTASGGPLDSPEYAAVIGLLSHVKPRKPSAPSAPPTPAHAAVSASIRINGRWL